MRGLRSIPCLIFRRYSDEYVITSFLIDFSDADPCKVVDCDINISMRDLNVDGEFLIPVSGDDIFIEFIFVNLVDQSSFLLKLSFRVLGLAVNIDFGGLLRGDFDEEDAFLARLLLYDHHFIGHLLSFLSLLLERIQA